ncbi:ORF81 [Agrotis segetum granulovirus]|uniref:ORF81 n=1 Tax=Agrotis segetum granulosis virus TaxID=10464 RepID=Q6QXM1_GVAS|nr:odv-e25 [Agrotis segetum granulovirus]AAS82657.1 ORF81 [Agrotis segetum granulovirus]AHN92132.1 odv-e25 [Agrotis segetum granulovirus]AKN63369.1 odv-e25 [Agrotis segetum granulovirus]
MFGAIVLLLVIGAVLYLLYSNDKLNGDSINNSSDQSGDSMDSLQVEKQNANNVRTISPNRVKNVRLAHGDNLFSKLTVTEAPISYDQAVNHGDRLGANTVFLGVLDQPLGGLPNLNRQTANVTIKQFKNLFIMFKGLDFVEIDNNNLMVRYEVGSLVYALIDASNATLPDLLRDVNYPIVVLTNNSSAQLVLKEWGYTQINNSGTLFVKNEKSFRLQ